MTAGDWRNGANLTSMIAAQGQCATSPGIVYTVPASTYVKINKFAVANTTTTASTVTFGVAKNGFTPGAAGTTLCHSFPITARGSAGAQFVGTEFDDMVLGPGDKVWSQAGIAGSIDYTLSIIVSDG